MAQLPSDPKDAALEDFGALHFASPGAYVETGDGNSRVLTFAFANAKLVDASIQQPLHGTVATWTPG